jgi:very-short-patch-repair endonuclease
MRREQTDAEQKLWLLLRDRRLGGAKFRRQAPVGPYIADFICPRRKLIVEADGGQHIDNSRDAERDRWLAQEGYAVVRYGNIDILKNPNGVLTNLIDRLRERPRFFGNSPSPGLGSLRSPRPPSPPEGRG